MPLIDYKEGADFPELPTKTPVLCKIIKSKFVTEPNPFFGRATGRKDKNDEDIIDENEDRDVIKIIFESVEDETEGTRAWFNPTASINEKSNLRKLLDAMFETDPDTKTLKAFDTDDLEGMYVYIIGTYGPKDTDHKFLRPESFARYGKQFKADFKAPGRTAAAAADQGAEVEDEGDEETALKAKLAAIKAKKAGPKPETAVEKLRRELAEAEAEDKAEAEHIEAERGEPEARSTRKPSTREKTVAKTPRKKETESDPEAAF
jgi:hypothetical protein